MTLILNEVKQAEQLIRDGEPGPKPSSTLLLLAAYYTQKQGLDVAQTGAKLHQFMQTGYQNYNPVLWEDIIEKLSKKAAKRPLREIDTVGITQQELDCIEKLKNIKYEKLVFTMLCHSKLYNMVSEKNNGWVNTDIPELFRLSRVIVKYRNDKFLYLNDIEQTMLLGNTGLISFSAKNDNLNMKLNFIDMEGKPVLHIHDFRELGYEYLNYRGAGRFKRCTRCGRLIRLKSSNDHSTKYCSECAKYIKNEQNKEYYRNRK